MSYFTGLDFLLSQRQRCRCLHFHIHNCLSFLRLPYTSEEYIIPGMFMTCCNVSKSTWPGHGWETNQPLFENYHWPVIQSPTFQTTCLGDCVTSNREKQTCSPTYSGVRSKEDGNLFPCLNVFHPRIAPCGSEGWGFVLKGGVILVPLISL